MKKFTGILLMLLLLCGAALAENTYHVEEFPIEKEDESIIAGWLYVPDGAENAPAVILCHGFNGTHRNMDGYAEYLAQRGYVCYTFDFCGGGMQSQSSGATTDMTLLTELDDLDAVVSFLAELDEVDASRLVIAGESQGGLVTALYTARNPETVRGAMLLYPGLMMADNARSQYADASEIPEKLDFMQMTVSRRYYEVVLELDPWTEIASFDKPVLLIHGTDDQIVPISVSEKALTIYPDARMITIHGAGHGFYLDDRETACKEMEAFLNEIDQ